jgi:hypothetical protein
MVKLLGERWPISIIQTPMSSAEGARIEAPLGCRGRMGSGEKAFPSAADHRGLGSVVRFSATPGAKPQTILSIKNDAGGT